MEIKDNVSECPPSSQVFEKSVRYYSGCGYITDLSTRHRPDRIASDVQAAPRFQIISPRRPSACRRVRYKRRFAQDTCRVGTQNALEGRFPAFAAGRPSHAHTRTHTHTHAQNRHLTTSSGFSLVTGPNFARSSIPTVSGLPAPATREWKRKATNGIFIKSSLYQAL